MENEPVVLLTGFGPFGEHKVNASWESIKKVSLNNLQQKLGIKIVTVEIPVVYKQVDDVIPASWEKYKPTLVVHVGVSAVAKQLTLETVARKIGYKRDDCEGKCPTDGISQCTASDLENISCQLDVKKICEEYNKLNNTIPACLSTNAGNYLCEYTYYASLSMDSSRTLFVHVPHIKDESFTTEAIAHGLEAIIELCLEQLKHCY